MTGFQAFPHIEGFHNVYKGLRRYFGSDLPTVTYRGKIKLHGTNAAVRIEPNGQITAQKRSGDCTPENDNAGFAAWVARNEWIPELRRFTTRGVTTVIHGEWAGPGIQKGVAVSNITEKRFFVFAVQYNDDFGHSIYTNPDEFDYLENVKNGFHVLPWATPRIQIDFSNQRKCAENAEYMNSLVDEVDSCDPYIKEVFGVEGHGEGIVFTPYRNPIGGRYGLTPQLYGSYVFKVKGSSHSKSKAAKPAKVGVMSSPSAFAFAEQFVTEDRLEQALAEGCEGIAEKRRTSAFLKWIGNDIEREGRDELEASGLVWKDVASLIATMSSKWFLARCESFEIEMKAA